MSGWFEIASGVSSILVGLLSICLAFLAFRVASQQYQHQARATELEPARAAVDHLFTEELATIRYQLYDRLNEVAQAASGSLSPERNSAIRREFGVSPESVSVPTRYHLTRRWARIPPRNSENVANREEFLRLASVLSAAFDSLFRIGEQSQIAAELIQKRVGRLIVWWILVWPDLFDHTGAFMGRKFLTDSNIRDHPPNNSSISGYTELWRDHPLWSLQDWEGALDNFKTLQTTMMPGDPLRGVVINIDVNESIYGEEGDALDYPSVRPDHAYLLTSGTARRLDWDWSAASAVRTRDGQIVGEVLDALGCEGLSSRVVQVAFGANRDLTNLAWKFKNYELEAGRQVSQDLIVLPGYVLDAEVVACNIGYWGYIYGALALHRPGIVERPYLLGYRVPVSVLLLDTIQVEVMHLSEGVPKASDIARDHVSCDVGIVDVEVLGRVLKAQLYALPLPFLTFDNKLPIAFETVQSEYPVRTVERMTQLEMWSGILHRLKPSLDSLLKDCDPLMAVDTIRAWAIERFGGKSGANEFGQHLYEAIRSGILDELTLTDSDGIAATGLRGCTPLLRGAEAWQSGPILGEQCGW